MATNDVDPELFRVSLICSCNQDLAYGYGADLDAARANAQGAFLRHHGRHARWHEEVVETVRITAGGSSHYEEAAPADMKDIHACVICAKPLAPDRTHVDTCGERCYHRLLKRQRARLGRG